MRFMEAITVALKIGGATGLSLFAVTNLETGSVGVAAAVPVVVFTASACWWVGRKFQALDDAVKRLDDKLCNLPCKNCPHKT